jgi:hypothetical protein
LPYIDFGSPGPPAVGLAHLLILNRSCIHGNKV